MNQGMKMPMLIQLFPHCEPEPPGIYLLAYRQSEL
jgi:hypothetical protein